MIKIVDLAVAHVHVCWMIMRDLELHYGYPVGGNWTQQKIHDEISGHSGLGAYDSENNLVAFCLYRQFPGFKDIMLLATSLKSQRTGAMKSIMGRLMSEKPPDEVIWIEVHPSNLPAICLYESVGFERCGERPQYYSDGAKALVYRYPGSTRV